MGYKAIGRYIKVAPRKARIVIDLIRGKEVKNALDILESLNKPTARYIKKILYSAVANAKASQAESREETLYIAKIKADEGPSLKRYHEGAMGRAMPYKKRSSHITIELEAR